MALGKALGKKGKLPKRLGGVKISKDLRKAGGRLIQAANSPAGRKMLAAGLSLAAAAATAAVEKERLKKGAAAGKAPDKPGGADPHDIGIQLGRMAEAALAGLFSGRKG